MPVTRSLPESISKDGGSLAAARLRARLLAVPVAVVALLSLVLIAAVPVRAATLSLDSVTNNTTCGQSGSNGSQSNRVNYGSCPTGDGRFAVSDSGTTSNSASAPASAEVNFNILSGVAADGGGDTYRYGSISYTLDFSVDASSGEKWSLDVGQNILGLYGLKGDGTGSAVGSQRNGSAGASAVTVDVDGQDLSFAPDPQSYSNNPSGSGSASREFSGSNSSSAVVSGSGDGSFSVTIEFDIGAFSNDGCSGFICSSLSGGEEAAVLMGYDDVFNLSTTRADNYSTWGRSSSADGYTSTWTLNLTECGNGVVEAGEACDGGGCCTDSCQIASAGSVCRASADATCDTAETCDGGSDTCPADAWVANGTVCDDGDGATISDQCTDGICAGINLCAGVTCSALDQCHTAGTCDPLTGVCSNPEAPDGTVCDDGDAATTSDQCTAGACAGVDLCAGVVCAAASECHVAGVCDAQTGICSVPFASAGTSCGDTSNGECSAPDTCDGAGSCLANHATSGAACGDAGSECTVADTCDGSGACTDNGFEAAGTSCGDSTDGECTAADTCDGSGACQDNHAASGAACGDAGDECTVADTCDGSGACTDNGFEAAGTSCGDTADGECTDADTCDGAGACQDNHASAGAACGDGGDECTVADACDGSGACTDNGFEAAGTSCGDSTDGECTSADTCDGSGTCEANHESAGTACGGSPDECHEQDSCDGSGACTDNGFEDAGAACGDSAADECTDADTCDGAGACQDNHAAAGAACGDEGGECTVADACDGSGACTDNGFEDAGTACGDGTDGECTNADTCDGSGACQANDVAEGTACGDGSDDACTDADTCDGSGACQANDADAGTACGDAEGECVNADACDGSGACSDNGFKAAGTACGDGSDTTCTSPDTCDGSGACDENHAADGTECRGSEAACDAVETCSGGACPADGDEPDGTACDDANPLTDGESCEVGVCACAPGECDYNCGDGTLDAAEECDDGNNQDGDWCSSLCTIEEGCGNGHVDLSETCDDGGNEDGDGCSSRCQIEAAQSKDQQKCIALGNRLAIKVAAAQNKENLTCLKLASSGKLPEGQDFDACIEADNKGKMAKIAAKLKAVQEGKGGDPSKTKCPETPDFAYVDDEDIYEAVVDEEVRFFGELLGDDLAAAAVDMTDKANKKQGICQKIVLKASDKVLQTQLKEFLACKEAVLKDKEAPAVSAEDLESCFDAIATDAKGKVEKARVKLVDLVAKKCTAFEHEVSDVLDGACGQGAGTPVEFSQCLVESGRCTSCRLFNAADGLAYDCDLFDDGEANDSCGDGGGGSGGSSPTGAFVDGPVLGMF